MSKRSAIEDIFPLTPMQEGMLFHALADEGTGAYVGQFGSLIRGDLDPEVFVQAWQSVVDRHTALRAAFAWEKTAKPLQVIRRCAPIPVRQEDWRGASEAEQQARLQAYLREDQQAGFDVQKAPLMRLALFRLTETTHQFVWTHHHLILDGWSLSVVYRDFLIFYSAHRRGETPRLGEPRSYRDYVAWLERQDRGRAERFWRELLAGFTTPTPLPVRPAAHGAAGEGAYGDVRVHFSEERTRVLQEQARRWRVTLGTLVHGAWGLLLARYAGDEDAVFGTTVSGRPAELPGADATVGLFINTLPVRVSAAPGQTAREWLEALQSQQVQAREYEYSPLVQVQKWSDVPAGEALFDCLVVFENFPVDRGLGELLDGLDGEGNLSVEQTNYPLVLTAKVTAHLDVHLRYDSTRVAAAAAERMVRHVVTLMEEILADPDRRLGEVSLLREEERAGALQGGRGEVRDFARQSLVHRVISERAAARPDAAAVACAGRTLTYRELDAEADRLAARLRARGVGAETPVALFLDRSVELAVAILATLKAGGAFVPLDPEYPAERLEYLLADSRARVVLTRAALAGALPAGDAEVVRVDETAPEAETASPAAAPAEVGPDALAYLCYTSGSTGRPKAAMVSHRSLLCYGDSMVRRMELTPADRVLQFASPAFDVMIEEVFPAWLSGACVVFPQGELLGSPHELLRVLDEQRVTAVELPTAFWHEWVRTLAEEGTALPRSLRLVLMGGERVLAERLAQWAGLGVPLLHVFGLTETTVTTTTLRLEAGDDGSRWSNLPIGVALDNAEVYVLDADRAPVPVGVPGELYIGGEAVARGYWGRPELTAERYVPHPCSAEAGARLYRTGDRVRRLEDGTTEFLGRIDQQVKVRGYRIEPAEIEAALAEHPAVREAVVVVREDTPGERRLVAYLVSADGAMPALEELRAHVAGALPAYMVPSAFVALDAIPLTRNGKVDRRALPAPDETRLRAEGSYQAPQSEAEATLAGIWAEVLRTDQVGVHDNFFELGGDSILSIQVVSRARRAGLHLTPRQLFEHPTIARLAQRVGSAAQASAAEGSEEGPAPLTPVQHWFFEQEVPERNHWNMPLLLRPARALDAAVLERALAAVAAHHGALRLRLARAAEGGWTQTLAPATEPVPFEVVDLSGVPEAELEAAVTGRSAALQRTLDLERGPVFRAAYFDLGAGCAPRLLLAVHHMVVDGVSWRILLEDLESACTQAERGETVDLGPASTPFTAWARRLAEHARAGGFDAELTYWSDQARRDVAPLPLDFRGGANTAGGARNVGVALTAEETRALLQEVPAAYRTQVGDVLLCALATALGEWTGERRVLVQMEGHGREEEVLGGVDLTRTVGWFTTLFPVLVDVRGLHGEGERLKAVKEQLRALPGRGLGYGALRYLGSDAARAALAAQPQAEVHFEYLGQLDGAVSDEAFFSIAPESAGDSSDRRAERGHLLAVSGGVLGGALHLRIEYGGELHRAETIERLAAGYLSALRGLIEHCRSAEAGGYTPSDFPLSGLDQAALDALLGSERGIEDVYPPTPMQEGMLFHTLLEPGSGMYVGQSSFVLRGRLDVDAFHDAWQTVLDRHSALRTTFLSTLAGGSVSVVRRRVEIPFTVEDWRSLPLAEQETALAGYLRDDRARGFDPAVAPLIRVALMRTGEDSYFLVWSFHQMVLDGWSLPLVFRDLVALYEAGRRGSEPRLGAAAPFRDYVAWLHRQDLSRAEPYWRETLAGFTTPTPLVVDRPASGEGGGTGVARLRFGPEAAAELQATMRRHGLTPNTAVQGAWALLLARYSGEPDVVFGTTVSGRPAELEGAEEMIGLFINTLPVRVRTPASAPLHSWLGELQAQNAALREHQHTPLVQAQGWSEVAAGTQLFDSIVVFQNFPLQVGEGVPGAERELEVASRDALEQGSFPMTLVATLQRELVVEAHYQRSRFEPEVAERMLEHLGVLLESMVANPDSRLADLPLLPAVERMQVLEGWNATEAELPPVCVHQLFERQARLTPEAVALSHGEQSLTYAELDVRANRLAHHLVALGVGPDARVGLCVSRSVEMLVGVLGVLKAGGAYVPLDPAYPADRLAYMLADSDAAVLLTQAHLEARLPASGAAVVRLDADWDRISLRGTGAPEVRTDPDNLAYVIYTSGSTGRPKGVAMPHRPLVNLLAWQERAWRGARAAVTLHYATISFDVSFQEIFSCWGTGGRLVLADDEVRQDPAAVLRLVEREGVERLFLPYVALQHMVEEAVARGIEPPTLREVQTAGEALRVTPAIRSWFGALGAVLNNQYGPSETHVVTSYALAADSAEWPLLPSIGGPIDNTRCYVLDARLEPVPVGVPGELYLGGDSLSRGYLGRPELTAEKFVPSPFAAEPGGRLYRTGDRVRWSADGTLEFQGRIDQQVKVRGFRIEPGEIESELEKHPSLREAVVVARDDLPGGKGLVAYVVAEDGAQVPAAALREHLLERLPEYMVPGVYVVLEALPLTPSGKTDRRALPAPQLQEEAAYVAPLTETEQTLAEIWAEVLELEQVGVHDNFFELGGHSLLAMRISARVRKAFGIEVPLAAVLGSPTIAALADAVEERMVTEVSADRMADHLKLLEELSDDEVEKLLGEVAQ